MARYMDKFILFSDDIDISQHQSIKQMAECNLVAWNHFGRKDHCIALIEAYIPMIITSNT